MNGMCGIVEGEGVSHLAEHMLNRPPIEGSNAVLEESTQQHHTSDGR